MSIEAMVWAKNQTTGSVSRKAVLMVLADRAGFSWTCWPSQATIARETELGERQVRRILAELVEGGFISRETRGKPGGGRSSDLITLLHEANRSDCPDWGKPDIGGGQTGHSEGGKPDTHVQRTVREPSEVEPSTSSARSRSQELFDEYFWPEFRAASERPGSKGDAWKAWTKLTVKERHEALEGIERHRTMIAQFPGRFVMPNGCTWLNKKRWMDETPQEPPRNGDVRSHPGVEHLRTILGAR